MAKLVYVIASSSYINTLRQSEINDFDQNAQGHALKVYKVTQEPNVFVLENIVFTIFQKETKCNIKSKITPLFNFLISLF